LGHNDKEFDKDKNRVQSPELSDTDFENELHVIFQLSNQPRKFDQYTIGSEALKLNFDYLWSGIRDRTMSDEEIRYQDYMAGSAQRAYRKLWSQASYPNALSSVSANESLADGRTLTSLESNQDAGPWFGEFGRMVFWRAQDTSRDFMWALKYNKDAPDTRKVSRQVTIVATWLTD
jgi:hypothetical protein